MFVAYKKTMDKILSLTFIKILSCAFLFCSTQAFAFSPDTTEYISESTLRYEDRIYKKNIRTAQLSADPAVMASAII